MTPHQFVVAKGHGRYILLHNQWIRALVEESFAPIEQSSVALNSVLLQLPDPSVSVFRLFGGRIYPLSYCSFIPLFLCNEDSFIPPYPFTLLHIIKDAFLRDDDPEILGIVTPQPNRDRNASQTTFLVYNSHYKPPTIITWQRRSEGVLTISVDDENLRFLKRKIAIELNDYDMAEQERLHELDEWRKIHG